MDVKVAPSILACDFSNLCKELSKVQTADYIHIDIMDGHFVPNITMGPMIVKTLKGITNIPLDVHLMIDNPQQFIPQFSQAGADIITVHIEADRHIDRTIELIKEYNVKPAISLNPATPVNCLEHLLEKIEMVLIMSVNPGFGGQSFIPYSVNKITKLKAMIENYKLNVDIEVDGGINQKTARSVIDAGANVLVAGTFIFGDENPNRQIKLLKNPAKEWKI